MGSLAELENEDKRVHMLCTNSSRAEIFVYDTLKRVHGANSESIVDIKTKKSIKDMLDLSMMNPYLADSWLFDIEYDKIRGTMKQVKSCFKSTSSVFLIRVKNYAQFKECKQELGRINDLYLQSIYSKEVSYLLKGYNLPPKLVSFVASGYRNDVDKIFELKELLESGTSIQTTKELISYIGNSGSSINSFAMSLLNPVKEKGKKTVIKNRLKEAKMLSDAYSPMKFKNFLAASVKDILDIKVLYNQGVIYKTIRDIPEVYNEKRLSKYSYCLEKITREIPYERVLNLYVMLRNCKWYKEQDILEFLYTYYGGDVSGDSC